MRVINSSKCWPYCCEVGWNSDKKGHLRCGLIDLGSPQKQIYKKKKHANLKIWKEALKVQVLGESATLLLDKDQAMIIFVGITIYAN